MKEGEVADKNRGRNVDGDDQPDDDDLEAFEDDEIEDDVDEDEDDAAVADDRPASARRKKAAAGTATSTVARKKTKEPTRRGGGGIFGRLARFVREIVAELQKVIWPTRKELLTYTTVVVVFVAVMMTFVALLDVGFVRVMFLVFGRGTTDSATVTP